MASAIQFPEQNFVFTCPEGMTDEECGSLPAYYDGEAIVSCWKLTPEELEEVQRTGNVWLMVFSPITPPVCVVGTTPFIQMVDTEVKDNG